MLRRGPDDADGRDQDARAGREGQQGGGEVLRYVREDLQDRGIEGTLQGSCAAYVCAGSAVLDRLYRVRAAEAISDLWNFLLEGLSVSEFLVCLLDRRVC